MTYKKLTHAEEKVIIHKGTEAPFSGEYYDNAENGKYLCKQCNTELFDSKDKFDSGCGWPSFDDEINDSVKKSIDADGRRTEILCKNCDGHLGHIFKGEGFTTKDTRYCVNSISLNFVKENLSENFEKAYFAAGCFWGVEYFFNKAWGVKSASSGYMGGHVNNPSYEQVCTKQTGHLEVVEVVFDKKETDFETLCKLFFEIHDPEQADGQGPDLGPQYISAIFYTNKNQKIIAEKLIKILSDKGLEIATKLIPAEKFFIAELYHQGYYDKNGKIPYCHSRVKRF
ncbi:MAG: bifunctional methionine sulfoxide reductase B/A protein [Rickettsiales bacterium]|nr:bifunctional methionine sulfoxide reductase B/A protein [Rickettsiales bacterium]